MMYMYMYMNIFYNNVTSIYISLFGLKWIKTIWLRNSKKNIFLKTNKTKFKNH